MPSCPRRLDTALKDLTIRAVTNLLADVRSHAAI